MTHLTFDLKRGQAFLLVLFVERTAPCRYGGAKRRDLFGSSAGTVQQPARYKGSLAYDLDRDGPGARFGTPERLPVTRRR